MILYRVFIAPLLVFVFLIGRLFSKKISQGFSLRQKAFPPLNGKPIWFHAASGEFEYAKPVIRELKKRFPTQKILVTYFSPTFSKGIENFEGVDASLALPFDLPAPLNHFLKFYDPKMCLIARTDLWPEMMTQTRARQIPIILFSATQSQNPSFFKRWLLNKLDFIYCVDDLDAKMLSMPDKVKVLGDTRYDQALFRLKYPKAVKQLPHQKPLLIAGSTWAEDEDVLLDSFPFSFVTLVLVPHEPTATHIAAIKKKTSFKPRLYSEYQPGDDCSFILVDQIGILAELYLQGDCAFVGGSFKKSVHSVMEPLAAGLHVAVGPYYQNNREAVEFEKLGVVSCVRNREQLHTWLKNSFKTKENIKLQVEKKQNVSTKFVDELIARYPENLQ